MYISVTCGLTEAIAPIFADNILIGYIYLSHIFSHASYEEGWTVIRQLCRNYDVDFAALKETCLEAPIIPEKNILSAANILNSVASYLYTSRMAYLKKENLIIQIDKYIEQHLSESINIPDICEYFQIGATHLYHLSMENYGMGIAAHIRSRRIEKAKELLAENTDLNISEIASACGFEDYNYFIALFKRTVGLSPKKYRDTCSEHGNTTLFKNFI